MVKWARKKVDCGIQVLLVIEDLMFLVKTQCRMTTTSQLHLSQH